MIKKIKIENNYISNNSECFIIAEAGVNHNGDLNNAILLADLAKEAGANAVKFQLYDAKEQVSKYAESAPYQRKGTGKKTMFSMSKLYDLPWENHRKISEHCRNIGIAYMSSCFDKNAVDFLIDDLKSDCIKIGSGEITNYPLLSYIAKKNVSIILSTGMCSLDDVKGSINHIRKYGNPPIIILHCVSNYPANEIHLNLKAMITLEKEFKCLIGYSDHSEGEIASTIAVALGAKIIEKHFTIDKNLPGPDHAMSLNPTQLKFFIDNIRLTEKILGTGIKEPTSGELKMIKYARRSVVSLKNINKGDKIEKDNISLKRPSTGIDPRFVDKIIGRRVNRDIKSDMPITWEMLD